MRHDEEKDHTPYGGSEHHHHAHAHGVVDPSIAASDLGIWAVKWSFALLLAIALMQAVVVYLSGSVDLLADGYHARVDGWTSLAVLFGALGVWLGYQLADPILGLLITLAILRIVWQSARAVFSRMLDGVDPDVIDQIRHEAIHTDGIEDVGQVRARWLGHRLHAEVNVAVAETMSVGEGHQTALVLRHRLLHKMKFLGNAVIHVDPANASGEEFHRISEHAHDGLTSHSHH